MSQVKLIFFIATLLTAISYNTNSNLSKNALRHSNNAASVKPKPTQSFRSTTVTLPTTDKSNTVHPRSNSNLQVSSSDQMKTTDQDPSKLDGEYSCSSKVGCGNMHVMCQYPVPGPSENCRGYVEIPITDDDILMVIHYFNFRRNLVAGGKEYKLPSASDMMMVEWDERLAAFAQRWADQCIYDPYIFRDNTILNSANDICRDLPDLDIAQVSTRIHGFNFTGASVESTLHLLINMISSDFFNVTTHVVLSGYVPEDDYGAVALHSKAYLIGCGVASYLLDLNTDGHRMSVIYCNIGPLNGMYLLDRYYKHGEPCSDCPSGTSCHPNSYFQFLCQKDNSLDNPKEVSYSRSPTTNSESSLLPSSYFQNELAVTLIYILMQYD